MKVIHFPYIILIAILIVFIIAATSAEDCQANDNVIMPIGDTTKDIAYDEAQTFANIKQAITPPQDVEAAPIEIYRGSNPLASNNSDDPEPKKDLGYEIDISDRSAEYIEDIRDTLTQAYQAASVGHYEAGIALYKQALRGDPDNLNSLYALGTLYQKLNQLEQARDVYKQVLEKSPAHKKALNNFLAVIAEETPDRALKELKELEKINPNFSPVQAQIGMIYAKQQNYKEAEKHLRKAVALSPYELSYLYNLAVLYDTMKHYKEARRLYRELLNAKHMHGDLPQSEDAIIQRLYILDTK